MSIIYKSNNGEMIGFFSELTSELSVTPEQHIPFGVYPLEAMGERHFAEVSNALKEINPYDTSDILDLIKNASMTYVIGNGGSAATATHFAADLSKATGLSIMSLDNLSALTAWGNDAGIEDVFCAQLQRLQRGDNEVLVAISTSGNSPNIVKAAEHFNGAVIALTGPGGGKLAELNNVIAHMAIDAEEIEVIEDCHSVICHSIVRMLKIWQT